MGESLNIKQSTESLKSQSHSAMGEQDLRGPLISPARPFKEEAHEKFPGT
jgi:hypothetical protein